jgi:hypothetical protein
MNCSIVVCVNLLSLKNIQLKDTVLQLVGILNVKNANTKLVAVLIWQTTWRLASKSPATLFQHERKDTVNGSDFKLNNNLYLATQQCGGGRQEAKVFAGLLGLHTNVLKGQWREMANKVGLKLIQLGKKLCDEENTLIEMELSSMDQETKRRKNLVCGDCRWDMRSSGRRYYSISGCSVMIGCRPQLVLDIAPMPNTCSQCAPD